MSKTTTNLDTAVLPLDGTEVIHIVQNNISKQIDLDSVLNVNLTNYDTNADLANAQPYSATNVVRVNGYSTAGDGGGAYYVLANSEPAHAAKIQDAANNWWEYIPEPSGVNVKVFGAVGGADLGAAISDAIDFALTGANPGKVIVPPDEYTWTTTANVATPEDLSIDFTEAKITCTLNDIALNLNSDYDPAPATPDTERRVFVSGGYITNSNATKTASEFIRAYGIRQFVAESMYVTNFWKGFVISSKDTYQFRDVYTYDNFIHFHIPALAVRTGDKTIGAKFDRVHISCSTGATVADEHAILVEDAVDLLSIESCLINGQTGNGQIMLIDNSLIATRLIKIEATNFEQYGDEGAIVTANTNGTGFENLTLEGCLFNSSTIGAKAVTLRDVRNFYSKNTRYNFGDEPNADGTEYGIQLDSECRNAQIEDGTVWGRSRLQFTGYGNSTPVDLNGCARTDVTLIPEFWAVDSGVINDGTNYTPITGLSSAGSTTIDMSLINAALGDNGTVLPPKAYVLSLDANDSGSETANTGVGVYVKKNGAGINNSLRVRLDGTPDDQVLNNNGQVFADANGDISYVPTASGAGTLDFRLALMGVIR